MRYEDQKKRGGEYLLKSLGLLLLGGAAAAATIVGYGAWRSSDQFFAALTHILNPVQQTAPKVDVQSIIIQQVRDVSELTTATFTMQAVVPTSRDTTVGGFVIGKTKLLYIAYGEVKAGVDLSRLAVENVQVTNDSIQIQLPSPRVLDSKIDVNRSNVYDYDRGLLGLGPDVAPELQSLAQQEALKKIVEAACTDGLLQKASDRAKLVVMQLLNTTGYKQVTVTIQPASPSVCLRAVAPTSASVSAPLTPSN